MPSTPETYLRASKSLIGRQAELDSVVATINGVDDPPIILLEGPGGIGKTRLLLEVGSLCQSREDLLCTEVIDLLLTRYHQPARIMLAIALQLQRAATERGCGEGLFRSYISALEDFYAARGEISDSQRAHLERAFLNDYGSLAARYRIVLLIDSLEKLHPTIHEVESFDFRLAGRLEQWLAHLLAQLPNTVTILAGRPRHSQRLLFTDSLARTFHTLSIAPFTFDETAAYIRSQFPEIADQTDIEGLHMISSGRPVVLAITLACMQHEVYDGTIPPGFTLQYPQNREQLSNAFVIHVLADLRHRFPTLARLIEKAVYLRKGLREPLLAQIAIDEQGYADPTVIAQDMATLAGLVFVKQLEEGVVLLHDEMYDLLFSTISEQHLGWWQSAIRYLDDQISLARAERNTLAISGDIQISSMGFARIQQKLQTLQIERMFYQMAIDPRQGYYTYRDLCSNAIASRDEDLDTQLQEELARFFESDTRWGQIYQQRLVESGIDWDRLIFDEGVRWVYRRIGASIAGVSPYTEAIRLAQQVAQRYPKIYAQSTLARCDLDAARLQALVYTGAPVDQEYRQLVADLEALLDQNDHDEGRYTRFIMANAHNYWGYSDRIQERLQSACARYSRAIKLYRENGPDVASLLAVTLNNLGYALARQGDSERGLRAVDEALAIARRAGARYRIATALNTRAHLLTDIGRLDEALRNMLEAGRIFDDLNSVRDQALCANAEGRIRSRIATGILNHADRDREFWRAAAAYRKAIERFDAGGELARRIETRLSLSKTYREWACMAPLVETVQDARHTALSLLQEAQQLSSERTPRIVRASILEAIAVIMVDKGQYDQAIIILDQARDVLPPNLRNPDRLDAIDTDETKELRLYWLRMAQIELQYALCAFGQQRYDHAITYSLRSVAGLVNFSLYASPIERFRTLIRSAIIAIGDIEEIRRLRDVNDREATRMVVEQSVRQTMDILFDQAIHELDLFGV
ncbi:MAG: ATP-binding protein [Oscillochloris sp.]|nr:ATP-binding protein [Oscillochloris sp.]